MNPRKTLAFNLWGFIILVVLSLIFRTKIYSQKLSLPSLEKTNIDNNAVSTDSLERLFLYYLDLDIDSSVTYLGVLKERCRLGFKLYDCAKYLLYTGIYYHRINNYDSALFYYHKSRPILHSLKDYRGYMAVNNNLGALHEEYGNIDSAAGYLFSILTFVDSVKDNSLDLELSKTFLNIGVLYQNQKEYALAEEYYIRSLKIKQKHEDIKGISVLYNNLAIVNYFKNDIKSAESYFLEALKIYELVKDIRGLSRTFFNIGEIYLYEYQNIDKALFYYKKAYEIGLQLNDYLSQVDCLIKLSECSVAKKDFAQAEKILNKALNIANKIRKTDLELEIFEQLTDVYLALNDYKKAVVIQKQILKLKDSLLKINSSERLIDIQEKYKSMIDSIGQNVVKESYQTNRIIRQGYLLFFVMLLIIFCAISIILFKYRNLQRISNKQAIKISILNKYIDNPIFVFVEQYKPLNVKLFYYRLGSLLNMLDVANQTGKEPDYKKAKRLIAIMLEETVFPNFERKFSMLSKGTSMHNNKIIRDLKKDLEEQLKFIDIPINPEGS